MRRSTFDIKLSNLPIKEEAREKKETTTYMYTEVNKKSSIDFVSRIKVINACWQNCMDFGDVERKKKEKNKTKQSEMKRTQSLRIGVRACAKEIYFVSMTENVSNKYLRNIWFKC